MNVLVVPMFALSRMGGPWNHAQAVAAAFERAGHHVVLGIAEDGSSLLVLKDAMYVYIIPNYNTEDVIV